MLRFHFTAMLMMAMFTISCSEKNHETLPDGLGIDLSNMDTTMNPGDDFFRYVNGGWLNKAEIPADQGSWGSFNELREDTRAKVLEVLMEATSGDDYPTGSDQRKAADFYSVGMDSMLAENTGLKPLLPYFEKINLIKNKEDIQACFVEQMKINGDAFFSVDVRPDLRNSNQTITYIRSSGLGLPERDYYLATDDKSKEIRARYHDYIADMLTMTGADKNNASAEADAIIKLETKLAIATMTKEDRRDPDKTYTKVYTGRLEEMLPSFSWDTFFESIGADKIDSVVITAPDFLPAVEKIINGSPLGDIKTYFRFHLINETAPYLNYDLVKKSNDFYSQYLNGVQEMRPRWKRVLDVTDRVLGEAIGKLYVEKNFPPEAKKKALEMVENIKLAFAERIKALDWMSDSTKESALNKLSTFSVKIGYPDEWKDYAGLVVDKDSYIQNVMNGRRFNFERQIAKLGKPVDRNEWFMTPQTVNAYYNPSYNEIVFPAAILQPPFYDYRVDEALNYGGIGAVIGHEISHGFDDKGSKFDGEGNRRDWWTKEDLTKFEERGDALAKQFDHYEPLPNVFVQGKFTLGENIGDLGGVAVAYEGLQRYYREHETPGNINGFTPDQRFFLSWATIWRVKYRDESLRTLVKTNPHSPGMYRANGPLSNMEEFYKAFNIKEGDKMFRPAGERVKIW